jgi:nucleoside-triphosphatase THEP1
MKVLLTAPPGTGKTTLLRKFITSHPCSQSGVLAQEIRDNNGTRIGFSMVTSDGKEELFMAKNASDVKWSSGESDIALQPMVGSYMVNVEAIERVSVSELQNALLSYDIQLVYIDEIGIAQSYSSLFLDITTIIYQDTEWSIPFKSLNDIWLIEVTIDNRNELLRILDILFQIKDDYEQLNTTQKRIFKNIFYNLLQNHLYISIKKLFKNTLSYILSNNIKYISNYNSIETFEIIGNTNTHIVTRDNINNLYICDCPMYKRINEYLDLNCNEKCSHQMCIEIKYSVDIV